MSISQAGTGASSDGGGTGWRMSGESSDLPSRHQAQEGRRRVWLGEGHRQGET